VTPLQTYQQDIDAGLITDDPVQRDVAGQLDQLYHQLLKQRSGSSGWFGRLRRRFSIGQPPSIRGLYLWGGVGIGKTYLMDSFFEALPGDRKARYHFHRFMRQLHDDLKRLPGHSDPLKIVAQQVAMQTDVLCFDEFVVHDITDAMLLANFFEALFECGVCLLATSNVPPDDLYQNGLQRMLFLPAIELIKQHTNVVHLPTETDYRERALSQQGVYFCPDDANADTQMQDLFQQLTIHAQAQTAPIIIEGRPINIIKATENMIWFDFKDICSIPRSQHDYLEIAKLYPTVFISHVPAIGAGEDDKVTYLIHLIDIFYDNRVKLVLSAEVPIEALYTKGKRLFEFDRTKSRLMEMQSLDYWQLARP
jgi:cell division protein ZapE